MPIVDGRLRSYTYDELLAENRQLRRQINEVNEAYIERGEKLATLERKVIALRGMACSRCIEMPQACADWPDCPAKRQYRGEGDGHD